MVHHPRLPRTHLLSHLVGPLHEAAPLRHLHGAGAVEGAAHHAVHQGHWPPPAVDPGGAPRPRLKKNARGRLGSARLGSARLGSARLGSARLGSARLGSARLGSRFFCFSAFPAGKPPKTMDVSGFVCFPCSRKTARFPPSEKPSKNGSPRCFCSMKQLF